MKMRDLWRKWNGELKISDTGYELFFLICKNHGWLKEGDAIVKNTDFSLRLQLFTPLFGIIDKPSFIANRELSGKTIPLAPPTGAPQRISTCSTNMLVLEVKCYTSYNDILLLLEIK